MDNTTIGAIIATLRYEKQYSRKKLCQGLCSTQMLIKIENDEADVDKFMLDMLLQRLGKSPDKLEVILSDEEYEKIYARDYIEELIWRNEKEQAYRLLEDYELRYAKDSNVQKMFVLRMRAYIYHFLEHDINKAESYIRDAIAVTLPGINNDNMSKYLLAGSEIENLLELGRCLFEQEKDSDVEILLRICQEYIDTNITDEVEYAKLNSKSSWLRARLLMKKDAHIQAYQICESAMECLRKHGILYFMMPLLEQLVICCDKLGIVGNRWKTYRDAVVKIYNDYGEKWYCHDSILHNCLQTSYHLASEFIRQERQAQELTQEQLIEGVYKAPENLSRMEKGKAMPTRKKFEGLMENLGFERGKYCGTIIVENFEALELKYEIDILIGRGKYQEAQQNLEILRETLDCNKKINFMAVQVYQTMIDSECGRLDVNETYERLSQLLEDSALLKEGKIYRVPFYNELLALNMLCRSLRKANRLQESTAIYEAIIEVVKKSKIDTKYQNNIMSLVLANANLFDTNKERCDMGIAYELSSGKGKMVYMHFLSQINLLEKENTSQEVVWLAFYMSDLFYRESNKNSIKEFYEQTYSEKLY
jgi:transcriptional regulator with XRE-family HTH domain